MADKQQNSSATGYIQHRQSQKNPISQDAEQQAKRVENVSSTQSAAAAATTLQTASQPAAPCEEDETLEFMKHGTMLIKVRPGGRRYRRHFCVEKDGTTLRYANNSNAMCASLFGGGKSKRDKRRISIKSIQEVRENAQPGGANLHGFHTPFERSNVPIFTLVVGEGELKTLDLVAPNPQAKELWVRGLRLLVRRSRNASVEEQETMWLSEKFQYADRNEDGTLGVEETRKLLQSLSLPPMQTDTIRRSYKKTKFTKEDFIELYNKLSKRHEIDSLFKKYAAGDVFVDEEELTKFFREEQGEILESHAARELIEASEPCPKLKEQKLLSFAGFNELLASRIMNIRKPVCRTVYQDMTQPLSHYFINSSHNTYLEGNQLTGWSSTEQYVRVLTHRCRCVELDVWDGDDDEPVVYHGHTMTSKISFRNVLQETNRHAFRKSEFPLILSIENHCSIEQQRIMARLLRETFGSQLLTEPLSGDCTCLPSPNELARKIIVKGKKLPPEFDVNDAQISDGDDDDDDDDDDEDKRRRSVHEKRHKLAKELSDCIVICQTASFTNFNKSKEAQTFAQMSSFEEKKALKLGKKEGVQYVQHNTRQLSRIYPKGTRVGSTNYDPIPMWNVGCQLVALNFQTRDDPLLLNYGRFEDNGACGYVLKPEFMRSEKSTFDCYAPISADNVRRLTVKVISGFNLPKKPGDEDSSILDPYVLVQVFGINQDNSKRQTKSIKNNGFLPVWNETLATFVIRCPELALVIFKVMDDGSDHEMVAQYCLPFNCIQTGYRMIALRDVKGNVVGATSLFVHVSISP